MHLKRTARNMKSPRLVAALLLLPTPSLIAASYSNGGQDPYYGDIYLALPGINGRVTQPEHKDEIEVLTCGWGQLNNGEFDPQGGKWNGKGEPMPLILTKYYDMATPQMAMNLLSSQPFAEATLSVYTHGGNGPRRVMTIELRDVVFVRSEVDTVEDRVMEVIELQYGAIRMTYHAAPNTNEQDQTFGWDFITNRPW